MRPVIGLNLDSVGEFSRLSHAYSDCIVDSGGIPILLPPVADRSAHDYYIETILGKLDAVILTGGNDLDCSNDGWLRHHTMNIMDHRREMFDRRLFKHIHLRRLPVLGIGVGMHLINAACKGTTILDIAEAMPNAMPHFDRHDPDHSHTIDIEPNSMMAAVFDGFFPKVSSCHHQAVDVVAEGFRVTAKAPDGVIEAIESTTPWFAVGVQFHPQSDAGSKVQRCVFSEFIRGINSTGPTMEAA